jgi:hypothetical protein
MYQRLWDALFPIVEEFVGSDLRDSKNYYTKDDLPDVPEGKVAEVIIRFVSAAKHSNLPES